MAHNSHYIFIRDWSQTPKQSTVAVGNGAVLKGFKQGSSGISLLFLKLDRSSVGRGLERCETSGAGILAGEEMVRASTRTNG